MRSSVGQGLQLVDDRGQRAGGGDEIAAQRVVEGGGDDGVAPDRVVVQGGDDLLGDPALGVAAQGAVLPGVGHRGKGPDPWARGEAAEQVRGAGKCLSCRFSMTVACQGLPPVARAARSRAKCSPGEHVPKSVTATPQSDRRAQNRPPRRSTAIGIP